MNVMKVQYFMPLYNDGDVVVHAVHHLLSQGACVHVLDGWSTDGGWEVLEALSVGDDRISLERFPARGPIETQVCASILERVERLSVISDAAWCGLSDADEFRLSSRYESHGETLVEGISRMDRFGYNVIDHFARLFLPTDNSYDGTVSPGTAIPGMAMFTDPLNAWASVPQEKLWKNERGVSVRLDGGGHNLSRIGKRLAPEKFVLKHYPYRSQEQAARRVRVRLERRCREEYERGWGVHYDSVVAPTTVFTRAPNELVF